MIIIYIIQYKLLEFDDNIVKANSTRTIYLQLYYEDEIDESLYSNKLYTASSTFKFTLSGSLTGIKGVFENPKTGVFTYSFLIVLLVGVFSAIYMFSKKKNVFKHFVIVFLLIVPTFVIADNLFNTEVEGTTTMEFIEPKRAIFDVGTVVNKKMHEMSGDIMPYWDQTTCYDPFSNNYGICYTSNEGDTTKIKHIVRADSLNSNNAQEVQSEDSDYKIWMWFDNGTIYYYSDADVNRMMFSTKEGLGEFLKSIVREEDQQKMFHFLEEFILGAYGEVSADGRQFIKKRDGELLSEGFMQSNAYSALLNEFIAGGDKAISDFINAVVPQATKEAIEKAQKEDKPVFRD